jgi:hypothetical protein
MRCHRRPCAECPWSKETPPGQFPRSRYEEIAGTSGSPGDDRPLGTPMFACHMTIEGREVPCAGWLVAIGLHHLTVRLLVAEGELPAEVLRPGPTGRSCTAPTPR